MIAAGSGLPLHAYYTQDRYKLFFLDVGLLQTVTQVDPALFLEEDITQIDLLHNLRLLSETSPLAPLHQVERGNKDREIQFSSPSPVAGEGFRVRSPRLCKSSNVLENSS